MGCKPGGESGHSLCTSTIGHCDIWRRTHSPRGDTITDGGSSAGGDTDTPAGADPHAYGATGADPHADRGTRADSYPNDGADRGGGDHSG